MRAAAVEGRFTEEQVEEAVARERSRLAEVYATVCRFVVDRLPFSFYDAIADRRATTAERPGDPRAFYVPGGFRERELVRPRAGAARQRTDRPQHVQCAS